MVSLVPGGRRGPPAVAGDAEALLDDAT